jgi:hypothetical protein
MQPPHILIVNELGLFLLKDLLCLHETAIICLGDSLKYRPRGLNEPENFLELGSLREAIGHALGLEIEQVCIPPA